MADVQLSPLHRCDWCPTAVFTSLCLSPNCPFSSFISHIHSSNGFSVGVSSSKSEPVADLLLIRFYFKPGCPLLSRCRLFHSFLPYSLSLCLFACLDFFYSFYTVTVIPIVACTLEILPMGLKRRLEELKIKGRMETIQTPLLRSTRIRRRVLETCEDLLSF